MSNKNYLFYSVLLGVFVIVIGALIFAASHYEPVPPGGESQIITAQASYQCADGHTVQAVFMTRGPLPAVVPGQPPVSNAYVSLNLDDALGVTLPQAISADGSRYANPDESLVFWSKGNGALVLENGKESTYQNCIVVSEDPGSLPSVYLDATNNFTLRYKAGYTVDDTYTYDLLGPLRAIAGVKFTIPATAAVSTNLSSDSYISVEHLDTPSCVPGDFLSTGSSTEVTRVTAKDVTYLVASTTEAGAGNRYNEQVYVIEGVETCVAIRYFIHSTVFENYPAGTVTEFDGAALLAEFDAIRDSLVIDAQFAPAHLLDADVYPLYEPLQWRNEVAGEYANLKGYVVAAEPLPNITDIAAVTQPFETWYADRLIGNGWKEDISMSAGGPGSAVIAYTKDGNYIVLQYNSTFEVLRDDEPAECPCSVQLSIFSGSI